MLSERDQLQVQNTDLQRVNTALKCELEQYQKWAQETGAEEMVQRLKQVQDMLYQYRESTSVETIAKIRSLTIELTQKTTLVD